MKNIASISLRSLTAVALIGGVALTAMPAKADSETLGTLAGAGAGAYIGNQFGRGSGNIAATVGGAVIGGAVGNAIGSNQDRYEESRNRTYYEPSPYYGSTYTTTYVQPAPVYYAAPPTRVVYVDEYRPWRHYRYYHRHW
jgi:phage tail tape-measure protein